MVYLYQPKAVLLVLINMKRLFEENVARTGAEEVPHCASEQVAEGSWGLLNPVLPFFLLPLHPKADDKGLPELLRK